MELRLPCESFRAAFRIDLNSYLNYEIDKDKSKAGKEIEEIAGLIESYEFALTNKLNEKSLLVCLKMNSRAHHLLEVI